MEKKRLTAIKSGIKSISSGRYVTQEGMSPNYVITQHGMRLSRVRVLGTIVDKFVPEGGKFAAITMDDGTDTIRAKAFSSLSIFDSVSVGDIIDLIGKLREYQGEIYIVPETISKADCNFEMLRQLEIREQEKRWSEKARLVAEHTSHVSDAEELKRLMRERFGIPEE